MFVYQNTDNNICITFEDNKPVEAPEYVLIVDAENKKVMLNGADSAATADTSALDAANATIDTLNKDLAAANAEVKELKATIETLEAQLAEVEA